MASSWRYFGCAVGFGVGVVWMTVGIGSAILVLLCAALGYGIAFVAERERAGLGKLRQSKQTTLDELDELDVDEVAPLSAEAEYGWPAPSYPVAQ